MQKLLIEETPQQAQRRQVREAGLALDAAEADVESARERYMTAQEVLSLRQEAYRLALEASHPVVTERTEWKISLRAEVGGPEDTVTPAAGQPALAPASAQPALAPEAAEKPKRTRRAKEKPAPATPAVEPPEPIAQTDVPDDRPCEVCGECIRAPLARCLGCEHAQAMGASIISDEGATAGFRLWSFPVGAQVAAVARADASGFGNWGDAARGSDVPTQDRVARAVSGRLGREVRVARVADLETTAELVIEFEEVTRAASLFPDAAASGAGPYGG